MAAGEPVRADPASAVVVVALTGGPCGGKTAGITLIRQWLDSAGFKTSVAPENATGLMANGQGFDPAWAGDEARVEEFQNILFRQ
eukprot:SAG11_NODE_15705_length_568_cov_9.978678_1_plen_85_part_00